MLGKALVICNNHIYIYLDENEVLLNLRIILSSGRHFMLSKVFREVPRKHLMLHCEYIKNTESFCFQLRLSFDAKT